MTQLGENRLINWVGDPGYIWWVKEQSLMQRSRLTWPYLREENDKSGLVERLNGVQKGPFDSFM